MKLAIWKDELYPEEDMIVDLPLTDKIQSLNELKADLGFPRYVNTEYFPMKRAIVTLWAAKHAHELHKIFPEIRGRTFKKPINMLLVGGAAFKIRCPSSNLADGPLNRPIHDVDFMMLKKKHREVKRFLLELGKMCGTQYLHFMTHHDRRFTSLQAGNRILARAFNEIKRDGTPVVAPIDIMADRIEMCHTIDVRDDFKNVPENMFTISLLNLLLTKTQFISDVDRRMEENFQKAGEGYRILPYPFYNKDRILVGMERKDFMDLAALLLDHKFGNDKDKLNIEALLKILKKDKKLRLTVRLNLQNMLINIGMIKGLEATASQLATIKTRLQTLLDNVPEVDKKWSKPWWNTAVETPKIPF